MSSHQKKSKSKTVRVRPTEIEVPFSPTTEKSGEASPSKRRNHTTNGRKSKSKNTVRPLKSPEKSPTMTSPDKSPTEKKFKEEDRSFNTTVVETRAGASEIDTVLTN